MNIETQVEKTLNLVALAGNPNCGKTALFNALTGGRQKVGNYAGVTVDGPAWYLQSGRENSG
jgi:ferrous iron transport protein B